MVILYVNIMMRDAVIILLFSNKSTKFFVNILTFFLRSISVFFYMASLFFECLLILAHIKASSPSTC